MIDFEPIRRRELRAAAELAARAFEDYEYFTNYFPNPDERRRVLRGVIYREYLTNYGKVHLLSARVDGQLAATAQLNAPEYRKPSDLSYLLHGWPLVKKRLVPTILNGQIKKKSSLGFPVWRRFRPQSNTNKNLFLQQI